MKKRGALNLGISTVVVLVIAMVLIGAGVSFIRGVFGGIPMPGDLIDPSDLANPPSRDRPITLDPGTITVSNRDSDKIIHIGFYNREIGGADWVPNITQCTGNLAGSNLPKIETLPQRVEGSSSIGFTALFKLKDASVTTNVPSGQYICTLAMRDVSNSNPLANVTRQINIHVLD